MYCDSKEDVKGLLEKSFENGGLLVQQEQLGANFFDLSSGVAGELLQIFTTYGSKLALVVPDTSLYSESFQQLVLEHRTHNAVRFFADTDTAAKWLQEALA